MGGIIVCIMGGAAAAFSLPPFFIFDFFSETLRHAGRVGAGSSPALIGSGIGGIGIMPGGMPIPGIPVMGIGMPPGGKRAGTVGALQTACQQ